MCTLGMNIAQHENQSAIVIAKTCNCKGAERKVTYIFVGETHGLCLDKKDIIQAEIEACEKLAKYAIDEADKKAVEKEISDHRMSLDLLT